jgi:hypothetical protein
MRIDDFSGMDFRLASNRLASNQERLPLEKDAETIFHLRDDLITQGENIGSAGISRVGDGEGVSHRKSG